MLCSLQVTQDDLDREFMPHRGRRKFTKADAIYGMWAEHDSDDERGCVLLHCISVHSVIQMSHSYFQISITVVCVCVCVCVLTEEALRTTVVRWGLCLQGCREGRERREREREGPTRKRR